MSSKIVILLGVFAFIQAISAQYLGYGNLQNGLPTSNYVSSLAQNNFASNLYGANNFANAYGVNNLAGNAATNNIISSNAALTGNLGLGQNLAANVVSNNFAGQNIASNNVLAQNLAGNGLNNIASNNLLGQNVAANSLNNIASNNFLGQNLAANSLNSANIASTAGLLEGITASNGGVFSVTSTSPIVPTGVSVYSDNLLIEGPLTVSGQLPFLTAVAVEGSVPTSGQGAAGCGCGDGNIGIVNELNNGGMYGGLGRPGLGRY